MAEWIGQTLSKVEIQKLLGRGGMADVYMGRHTTLNRPVAVKILHSHLSDNETLLARFRAEAQSVASMRHPHIVQVLDFDLTNDRPYIIMELLDGVSLKDYLQDVNELGRRLDPGTIARLIAPLASALDYAHARGIIHRDVKPANVMLRRDGPIDPAVPLARDVDVVLTDFGVARMADGSSNTASGVIIGTPSYMSPEQVRGEQVDGRSDIYALGIMLYEMLAGKLPFDSDTQASILIKHISEAPPPLTNVSTQMQAIINRALAKDPAQRYQKASELTAAVEEAFGMMTAQGITEPVLSTPPPIARGSTADLATKQLNVPPEVTSAGMLPTADKTVAGDTPPARKQISPLWFAIGGLGLAIVIAGALIFNGENNASSDNENVEVPVIGTDEAAADPTDPPVTDVEPTSEQPTEAAIATLTADPVGHVLLRDGEVAIQLEGVEPPPDGSVYEAWLTEPGSDPLSLGVIEVTDSAITLAYADPDARNLVSQYSEFVLTVESDDDPEMSSDIRYRGQIPAEQLARLRLMFEITRNLPLGDAVRQGAAGQAGVYDAHMTNTVNAINGDDIGMAKAHAEHVINIISGRGSEQFADYDGNGRPDNPGDGVGLANYLLILQESALTAASATGADEDDMNIAGEINGQVNSLLLVINAALNDELSVTAADSTSELAAISADLQTLLIQEAVDALVEQAESLNLAVGIEIFPVQ